MFRLRKTECYESFEGEFSGEVVCVWGGGGGGRGEGGLDFRVFVSNRSPCLARRRTSTLNAYIHRH